MHFIGLLSSAPTGDGAKKRFAAPICSSLTSLSILICRLDYSSVFFPADTENACLEFSGAMAIANAAFIRMGRNQKSDGDLSVRHPIPITARNLQSDSISK